MAVIDAGPTAVEALDERLTILNEVTQTLFPDARGYINSFDSFFEQARENGESPDAIPVLSLPGQIRPVILNQGRTVDGRLTRSALFDITEARLPRRSSLEGHSRTTLKVISLIEDTNVLLGEWHLLEIDHIADIHREGYSPTPLSGDEIGGLNQIPKGRLEHALVIGKIIPIR